MNIDKRLNKIHQELQEVALKMEVSNTQPGDRKGDYVVMKNKNYRGREFIALLLSDPYKDEDYKNMDRDINPKSKAWFVYFVAENTSHFRQGDFFKAEAKWNSKRKIWIWDNSLMKDVKMPRNWNPPK